MQSRTEARAGTRPSSTALIALASLLVSSIALASAPAPGSGGGSTGGTFGPPTTAGPERRSAHVSSGYHKQVEKPGAGSARREFAGGTHGQ